MKLRFYNARYLDTNEMAVKKGTVCTNGERFSYVGSTENAPENEVYDRDIDLKTTLLSPASATLTPTRPWFSCAPLRKIFRWTDG